MSGERAYVDPVKLEAFGGELERGTNRLGQIMSALNGELSMLGNTWQDEQYRDFKARMAAAIRQIEIFKTESARAQLQLQIDADNARRFQRHGLS
jgi:hypothetical protein